MHSESRVGPPTFQKRNMIIFSISQNAYILRQTHTQDASGARSFDLTLWIKFHQLRCCMNDLHHSDRFFTPPINGWRGRESDWHPLSIWFFPPSAGSCTHVLWTQLYAVKGLTHRCQSRLTHTQRHSSVAHWGKMWEGQHLAPCHCQVSSTASANIRSPISSAKLQTYFKC